jgi:hypothetical protein
MMMNMLRSHGALRWSQSEPLYVEPKVTRLPFHFTFTFLHYIMIMIIAIYSRSHLLKNSSAVRLGR